MILSNLQMNESFSSKIQKVILSFSIVLQQVFHVLIDFKEGCLPFPSSVLTEHPNNSFPSKTVVLPLYSKRLFINRYIT